MATAWTSASYVTPMLPTNYASLLTDQGTTLAAQITIATGIVQGDLESFYWDFPEAGGTPPTPVYIQRVTGILTAHLVHQILGRANEITDPENQSALSYEMQYRQAIGRLTGVDQPEGRATATVPRYRVSGEAMTFGTSPFGSDQYAFTPTGLTAGRYEVVPGSVQVSGYERGEGEDFTVYYSAPNRAWVLERISSGIANGTLVAYDITWLREREATRPDVVSWSKASRA